MFMFLLHVLLQISAILSNLSFILCVGWFGLLMILSSLSLNSNSFFSFINKVEDTKKKRKGYCYYYSL